MITIRIIINVIECVSNCNTELVELELVETKLSINWHICTHAHKFKIRVLLWPQAGLCEVTNCAFDTLKINITNKSNNKDACMHTVPSVGCLVGEWLGSSVGFNDAASLGF